MEELNKKIPQLPWIVATIGIIIAGWFFLSASKINAELNDRQCEVAVYKLKLEQYKTLETVYGRASDRYYAKQPILILRPEGAEGKITIYWNTSNVKIPDGIEPTAIRSPDINIEASWAGGWYGDENNLTDLVVTPGKNTGCYPISFTNNLDDDKFQVLVVVK